MTTNVNIECPHCKERFGLGINTQPNLQDAYSNGSYGEYYFPKNWERYSSMSLSEVAEVDLSYLVSLQQRTSRPVIGKLREAIDKFLDNL